MSGINKDVKAIVARLERDYGCTVRTGSFGHYIVTRPGYPRLINISRSPSDGRALKNIRADVRRYLGIVL